MLSGVADNWCQVFPDKGLSAECAERFPIVNSQGSVTGTRFSRSRCHRGKRYACGRQWRKTFLRR